MFVIVKFEDEGDQVSVVTGAWYQDGYCAWPPSGNLRLLGKKGEMPTDK